MAQGTGHGAWKGRPSPLPFVPRPILVQGTEHRAQGKGLRAWVEKLDFVSFEKDKGKWGNGDKETSSVIGN